MNNDDMNHPLNPTNDSHVDKDFDCYCGKHRLCNSPPKTIFALIISMIILSFAIVFCFVHTSSLNVFLPIITGILGIWVPSPLQSSTTRKDVLQNEQIIRNNMQTQRLLLNNSRPNFSNQQPNRMNGMNGMNGNNRINEQDRP